VLRAPVSADAQVTVYDEAGQWIGNYGAAGQPLQQAIWLDNYPVALINAPRAGVPEVAYVQPDHLGTPRVVIDPVRDVAIWEWSSKSEVFGNQVPNADADGDGVGFELVLRFPGQQATYASGMFYNYQRDYDPAVGRYSQSDPIGLLGGISAFGYVSGDPLSSLDPEGMQQRAATQAARSFANVAPTNAADGFQIHEGRYATHYPGFSPWSRPSFVPGPGILTTVAMAGMMSLVASPDGWSGIIGQFSNGKDSCPIS